MAISPFDGPIPGQSLTDEPGGVPWEQPPMHSSPEAALEWHMQNLSSEEALDNFLGMIDMGVPVSVMVDTSLSMAVMNGIHSVDAKMLLKPILFSHAKALCDAAGIEYKETMADYQDKDAIAKAKRAKRIAAKLRVATETRKKMDKGDILQKQVAEEMVESQDYEEAETQEYEQQEAKAGGLMSKEQM